jgi:hypothetical protein
LFATTMSIVDVKDSLVLVDTPELGIASTSHETFVQWIRSIAGNNQLLIATGSETMASAHRKELFVNLASRSGGTK